MTPRPSTPLPALIHEIDERSVRQDDELLGFLMLMVWPSLSARLQ